MCQHFIFFFISLIPFFYSVENVLVSISIAWNIKHCDMIETTTTIFGSTTFWCCEFWIFSMLNFRFNKGNPLPGGFFGGLAYVCMSWCMPYADKVVFQKQFWMHVFNVECFFVFFFGFRFRGSFPMFQMCTLSKYVFNVHLFVQISIHLHYQYRHQ